VSDGPLPVVPAPAGAWHGGQVGTRARCVLAPNPGPMTLDGTNTWVLVEPGSSEAVVVDPGPDDESHLRAVLTVVERLGAHVTTTLLTHGHLDHSAGAARFSRLSRSPVRALDPAQRLGDEGLGEGDTVSAGGLDLRVVATPGHTSDSLSFLVPADGAVLTGDTVLGRGTTVVAHPDGRLDDYLQSLDRLRLLAARGAVATVLPGHGPALQDAQRAIEGYLAHRKERLRQVHAALLAGARTPREVVETVYADVDRSLWPAAELSVRAQLDYLQQNDQPISWRD
jgi:glyoxylase-like metal-dependent hydrolase (beta-lactamase superfamily II)